jgi:hypothetical protein
LLLVLHRALVDFVALPKTGRTGGEAKPFVEPIQSFTAPEAAAVKRVTENSLPENAAKEQGHQPFASSVEEPTTGRQPKRCKPRKPKPDRSAKLEKALKLLDEGKSRRAIAKAIGVAESTLRAWLKSERVACVPS